MTAQTKGENTTNTKKKNVLIALLVILLVVAMGGLYILDRMQSKGGGDDDDDKNKSILQRQKLVLGDTTYYLKKGVTAYLIMGTDKSDELASNEQDLEDGYICKMADMLMVVVVDKEEKCYSILQLDRNTITTLHMLYPDGEIADDTVQQLCTAYYYGHDDESASENTVDAVSVLLNDTPIERYVSVDMSAIEKINNIAGGVTVTLKDDFSALDPEMKKGKTLKLTDEQAKIYATGRMSIGEGTNKGRLRRQRAYIENFIECMKEKVEEDSGYINTAYDEMTDLMTTNSTDKDLGNLGAILLTYEDKGIVTLKGETVTNDTFGDGEEHEEFTPDEDALLQTVIDLFYTTY